MALLLLPEALSNALLDLASACIGTKIRRANGAAPTATAPATTIVRWTILGRARAVREGEIEIELCVCICVRVRACVHAHNAVVD